MIETNRLILRRFKQNDYLDLYEYMSKESVVKYEPYDAFTIDECIEETKIRTEDKVVRFFAVCLKETGKLIGHIYFDQIEPKHFRTWRLGYVFNPEFHGCGYATEASKRILEYGFEEKNAHRVIAGVNVENIPSINVLKRLSMRLEGKLLQHAYHKLDDNGEPIWVDSLQYALLRSEYKSN